MRTVKQSTARNVMVFMVDETDHVTGLASLTLTVTASKNGAAFASITPSAVDDRGDGWYSVGLSSTHTNTLGDLALHITATGADPTDMALDVIAFDLADADPPVDVVKWLGTAVATPTNAGVPEVDVTHATGIATVATATGLFTVDVSTYGNSNPGRPVDAYYPDRFKQSESTAARRRVYFQARSVDRNGTRNPGDPINSWNAVVMSGRVSKNGAAGAAHAGTFTKVDTTNSPGLWYYEFAAAELNTLGLVSLYVSSSGFLAANESQMVPLTLAVTVAASEVIDTADVHVTSIADDTITAASIEDSAFTEFKFDSTFYVAAADAVWNAISTAALEAIRDKLLNYVYRADAGAGPDRTVRGLFRRLGAAIEKATGLKGSTVTYFQPDGVTTEFSVTQDVANGTRTNPVVTNSEVP